MGTKPETATLARGGAGVRSREAGGGYASRAFALHRDLHRLAAAGGRRGHAVRRSRRRGELIRRANSVELVRPRELALEGQRCADGERAGLFTNASERLQDVAVQSGLAQTEDVSTDPLSQPRMGRTQVRSEGNRHIPDCRTEALKEGALQALSSHGHLEVEPLWSSSRPKAAPHE
jgi:hypothetical protein